MGFSCIDLAWGRRIFRRRAALVIFWTARRLPIVNHGHANGCDLHDDRVVIAEDSSCELGGVRKIRVLIHSVSEPILRHTQFVKQVQDHQACGDLSDSMKVVQIVIGGSDVREIVARIFRRFGPHLRFMHEADASFADSAHNVRGSPSAFGLARMCALNASRSAAVVVLMCQLPK